MLARCDPGGDVVGIIVWPSATSRRAGISNFPGHPCAHKPGRQLQGSCEWLHHRRKFVIIRMRASGYFFRIWLVAGYRSVWACDCPLARDRVSVARKGDYFFAVGGFTATSCPFSILPGPPTIPRRTMKGIGDMMRILGSSFINHFPVVVGFGKHYRFTSRGIGPSPDSCARLLVSETVHAQPRGTARECQDTKMTF